MRVRDATAAALWYAAALPLALVAVPLTSLALGLVELVSLLQSALACRAGDEQVMAAKDAMWEPSPPPATQTVITAMLVVDAVSIVELRAMVAHSLVDARAADGALKYPRFTSRVRKRGGGRYSWVRHGAFAIERHVGYAPGWVRDEASALRRVGELASGVEDGMRYDEPLWRFELVEAWEGGKASLLLLQLHHSMADGISLVQLLLHIMQDEAEHAAAAAPRHVGARERSGLLPLCRVLLEGPLIALRALLQPRAQGRLAARPSGRKRTASAPPMALADVKAVARASDCTVNDVIASCVAAAVRARELELGTGALPRRTTAVVPINTRRQGAPVTMENELAVIFAHLPCAEPLGAAACLRAVHDELVRLKASAEPHGMATAGRLVHRLLPAPLNRWLTDRCADQAALLLSTLPGPQARVRWGGCCVRQVRFWSPTRAQVCVSASAFSYAGEVTLCVMADAAADEQPEALCRLFVGAFEQLCAEVLLQGHPLTLATEAPPAAAAGSVPVARPSRSGARAAAPSALL